MYQDSRNLIWHCGSRDVEELMIPFGSLHRTTVATLQVRPDELCKQRVLGFKVQSQLHSVSDHCVEQADCVVQTTWEEMPGTRAGGGCRRKAQLPPTLARLVQLQNLPACALSPCYLEGAAFRQRSATLPIPSLASIWNKANLPFHQPGLFTDFWAAISRSPHTCHLVTEGIGFWF